MSSASVSSNESSTLFLLLLLLLLFTINSLLGLCINGAIELLSIMASERGVCIGIVECSVNGEIHVLCDVTAGVESKVFQTCLALLSIVIIHLSLPNQTSVSSGNKCAFY